MLRRPLVPVGAVATAVGAALALSACTGDAEPTIPAVTTTGARPSSPATTGATPTPERTIDTSRWCTAGTVEEGDLTLEFGAPAVATGDEWTESLGRTWRPYVPVTVTNELDVPCMFDLNLDVAIDGVTGREDVRVPLQPGQSYRFQAFDLSELVEIADTKDAVADLKVTTGQTGSQRNPLIDDYYELEAEVGEIEGAGKDAVLPVSVGLGAVRAGMPRHTGSVEYLTVVGLDAQGTVVTKAFHETEGKAQFGGRIDVLIPVAGGDSSGVTRNQVPLSAYDDVVEYKVYLQPNQTEINDLFADK